MIFLDTNVISELIKTNPDAAVDDWFSRAEPNCSISVIALAEMAFGIARLPDGARKAWLSDRLDQWRIRYAPRTFAFSAASAMIFGDVMAKAVRSGHNMSTPDAQIAAIAIEHGADLATRNGKDFATTGLALINPWN